MDDSWEMLLVGKQDVVSWIGDQRGVTILPFDVLERRAALRPSVEKMRWAHRHLATLQRNIGEAFADPSNLAVTRADLDAKSGYHVLRVSEIPDWSEVSFLLTQSITDVLNPLRAAVDKFAWQLACLVAPNGSPKDPRGVKFPIAESPGEWTRAGRARNQFDPLHCGFIESHQPYHGVNGRPDTWRGDYVHPLALLQELTNDDKHRDTHPAYLVPDSFQFRTGPQIAERVDPQHGITLPDFEVLNADKPLELGLEVLRIRLIGADPQIDHACRLAPVVALPKRRSAVPALQRIESYVQFMLSEFAGEFPGVK